MTSRAIVLCLTALACAYGGIRNPPQHDRVVEYTGGRWFDGTVFVARTMYVVGGRFREDRPARIDSVVDIAGGFVVPPYADAHQHFLEPARISAYINTHIREGIFYVKDQGSAPYIRRLIDTALNRPGSIDFVSANQAWTSSRGHPIEIVRQGAQIGAYPAEFVRDSLDGGAVILADSVQDVARKWPAFLGSTPRPDFVKINLIRSNEHSVHLHDARYDFDRGLEPTVAAEIVRRAHASGLKVSAHVYTAADFRTALGIGVDQIAHVPAGRDADPAAFLVTNAEAALAARNGVSVVTTVAMRRDTALTTRLLRDQYAPNIRKLKAAGVTLLIGSDLFRGTATAEVTALARSDLFTNLELLRLWSVTTPRNIFPARRIGRLATGYEASFLVLDGDPLVEFSKTSAIRMRVRQGEHLN